MKTAAEWFNDLPPEIREKALKYCEIPDEDFNDLDEALLGSFAWSETEEGHSFWLDVHNQYARDQAPFEPRQKAEK